MYDMPERDVNEPGPLGEADHDRKAERPHGGRCSACERYPGGPATGYCYSERTLMCATGKPKPEHQKPLAIGGVTFCGCALGRWMREKALERKQGKGRAA